MYYVVLVLETQITSGFSGLSSLPIVKNTRSGGHNNGYAKLAISLESNSGEDSLATSAGKHWKKTNRKGVEEMVEMCEKSTETTPSLLDYDSNDDNFYLEDFDGYYDDSLSDYDEGNCSLSMIDFCHVLI